MEKNRILIIVFSLIVILIFFKYVQKPQENIEGVEVFPKTGNIFSVVITTQLWDINKLIYTCQKARDDLVSQGYCPSDCWDITEMGMKCNDYFNKKWNGASWGYGISWINNPLNIGKYFFLYDDTKASCPTVYWGSPSNILHRCTDPTLGSCWLTDETKCPLNTRLYMHYPKCIENKDCKTGEYCNSALACVLSYVAHSTKACYDNDIYWYDSNNVRNDLYQDCGVDSCAGWGSDYISGANTCHDRVCYDKGCSGTTCFSNSYTDTVCWSSYVVHSYKACYNNDVYWYDSNSARNDLYQDCGEDYCEAPGLPYPCEGGMCVDTLCYDKGCSGTTCFSTPSISRGTSVFEPVNLLTISPLTQTIKPGETKFYETGLINIENMPLILGATFVIQGEGGEVLKTEEGKIVFKK